MLKIIKKYKFSLFLATAFHVMLFSFIFLKWHPEQKQSKKIVFKQGEVMKATAVSVEQYQSKIKEIKNKAQKKEDQKKRQEKEKKRIQQTKKRAQAKKKELARKKELKRKTAAKKKAAEKKRKALAKKTADKKKKRAKEKELKKKKALTRKKVAEAKAKKLKEKKLRDEKLKKQKLKKEQERKATEQRRKQAEKQRQKEIAAESARLEADRVRREKGIVNRYAVLIQNKIARYWRRPANIDSKMKCTLNIRMTPDGEVISVKVTKGSGNFAFDRAAEKAVTGASPLPVPSDKNIFDKDFRSLTLNYEK